MHVRSGKDAAFRENISVIAPRQPHHSRSAFGSGRMPRCAGVSTEMEPMGSSGCDAQWQRRKDSWSKMLEILVREKRRELYDNVTAMEGRMEDRRELNDDADGARPFTPSGCSNVAFRTNTVRSEVKEVDCMKDSSVWSVSSKNLTRKRGAVWVAAAASPPCCPIILIRVS